MSEPIVALVVDDDALNRMVVARQLEILGCTVHERPDGFAGIDAVQSTGYDLVLVDIRMPGIDGVETSRRIRDLGETIRQPAIVGCTAFADGNTENLAREAGIDLLVEKPLVAERLAALLDDVRGAGRNGSNPGRILSRLD